MTNSASPDAAFELLSSFQTESAAHPHDQSATDVEQTDGRSAAVLSTFISPPPPPPPPPPSISPSSSAHNSFTDTKKRNPPCRTYRRKRYVEVKGGRSGVAMGTVSPSTPTNQLTKNRTRTTQTGLVKEAADRSRSRSSLRQHHPHTGEGPESKGAPLRFEANECVKKGGI